MAGPEYLGNPLDPAGVDEIAVIVAGDDALEQEILLSWFALPQVLSAV
jgi:hypothetical protein